MRASGEIKVGTASWTDPTLLASNWYPPEADTAERRLAYYARRFPLVEVDATYYHPPAERTARDWAARTPPGFTFNVKAFSLLTGHPTQVSAIYQDLRPETDKTTVYANAFAPRAYEEIWTRFLTALEPLAEAGKLGALLFQFPPWFTIRRENKQYLAEVAGRCQPWPVAVELRHPSWFAGDNQEETLSLLRRNALAHVVVDMPAGQRDSVPAVLTTTTPRLAMLRLHGHSEEWTSRDIHKKYGYEYSSSELRDWAPKLRELARHAEQTHALLNNCYSDYAQRNATELAGMLAAG